MKIVLTAALLVIAAATPAFAADVGVSISVGQPGFYGRIDIGNVPQPRLIFVEPVVIHREPRYVAVEPIYLHVPPGHEKNWGRHCAKYSACARPVYFVRNDWYENEYVPHYRKSAGNGQSGKAHDKGKGNKQR